MLFLNQEFLMYNTMHMNIQKETVERKVLFGKNFRIQMNKLNSAEFGKLLAQIYQELGAYSGQTNQGDKISTAVAYYKDYNEEQNDIDITVGFTVTDEFDHGEYTKVVLDNTENVFVADYVGPYHGLEKAHYEIMDVMAAEDSKIKQHTTLEEYLDKPGEVDEDKHKVKIYYYK